MTPSRALPVDLSALAELLAERYPLGPEARVTASAPPSQAGIRLVLELERRRGRRRELYELDLTLPSSSPRPADWDALVDAADGLFGMLVESDYAYRELPAGAGVRHGDVELVVDVRFRRPDLDRRSAELLGDEPE